MIWTVSGNTQPTIDTGTGTILEALFESTAKTYTLLRIVFLLLRTILISRPIGQCWNNPLLQLIIWHCVLQSFICPRYLWRVENCVETFESTAATLMDWQSIGGPAPLCSPSNGSSGSSWASQYGPLATMFMIPGMRRDFNLYPERPHICIIKL